MSSTEGPAGESLTVLWAISLPLFVWWCAAVVGAIWRLRKRRFDLSVSGVRAHVGRLEEQKQLSPTINCIGLLLMYGTPLFVYHFNRTLPQRRRVQKVLGELAVQWQPLFVMLCWGLSVVSIEGGIKFGLGLLLVGTSVTALVWAACAWHACGWSSPAAAWEYRLVAVVKLATFSIVAWVVVAVGMEAFAPVALTWLFLSVQMIPLILERSDATEERQFIRTLFEAAKLTSKQVDAAQKLLVLKDAKRAAVAAENFDTAERLAAEISQLQSAASLGKSEADTTSTSPEAVEAGDKSKPDEASSSPEGTGTMPENTEKRKRFQGFRSMISKSKRRVQGCIVLLTYAVWAGVAAPSGEKHIGLVTALAAVVVDITMALAVRCPMVSLEKGSFLVLLLQALARGALAIAMYYGSEFWFLGHCFIFLILGGYLIRVAIHQRMMAMYIGMGVLDLEDFSSSVRDEVLRMDKAEPSHSATETIKPLAKILGPNNKNLDIFLLVLLGLAFLLEIFAVYYYELSEVSFQGGLFSQWGIGLVVVGVLLAWAAVLYVFEMEKISDLEVQNASKVKLTSESKAFSDGSEDQSAPALEVQDTGVSLASQAASKNAMTVVKLRQRKRRNRVVTLLAFLAGIGAILFLITNAYVILSSFLFFPTVLVCAISLYQQWKLRDFNMWDKADALPPRDRRNTLQIQNSTNLQEETKPAETTTLGWSTGVPFTIATWRQGDFRRVYWIVAFFRLGLSVTDTVTFVNICFLGLSLLAWGYVADVGWYFGWLLPGMFLELFLIAWAHQSWHESARFRNAILPTALSLGLHIFIHSLFLGRDPSVYSEVVYGSGTLTTVEAGVLFSFIAVPIIVMLYFTYVQVQDDGMKLTSTTTAVAFVNLVLAVVLGLLLMILYSVYAGLAIFLFLAVFIYTGAVYHTWVVNRYYLPRVWKLSVILAIFLLVAAGCGLGIISSGIVSFFFFSLAFWGSVLGLILVSVALTMKAVGSGEYVSAAAATEALLLPYVRFSTNRGKLREDNTAFLCAFAALMLSIVWSLVATALLEQSSFGLMCFATLILLGTMFFVHNATDPSNKLLRAWKVLSESNGSGASLRATLGSKESAQEKDNSIEALELPPALFRVVRSARTSAIKSICQDDEAIMFAIGSEESSSEVTSATEVEASTEARWADVNSVSEADLVLSISVAKSLIHAGTTHSAKRYNNICKARGGQELREEEKEALRLAVAIEGAGLPGDGDPLDVESSATSMSSAQPADPESGADTALVGRVTAGKFSELAAALVTKLEKGRGMTNYPAMAAALRKAATAVQKEGPCWPISAASVEGTPTVKRFTKSGAATSASGARLSTWEALKCLQEQQATKFRTTALTLAHFQLEITRASALAESKRAAEFASFLAWVRQNVTREELGALAGPVLAAEPPLELADVTAWGNEFKVQLRSFADRYEGYLAEQKVKAEEARKDSEEQARRRRNIDEQKKIEKMGDEELKQAIEKLKAEQGADTGPADSEKLTRDARRQESLKKLEVELNRRLHQGTTDDLPPPSPPSGPGPPLIDDDSLPEPPVGPADVHHESDEDAKKREARRKQQLEELEEAKKRRNAHHKTVAPAPKDPVVAADDDDDHGQVFETALSLPPTLHDRCARWASASKDLGITQLSALPADVSVQTGAGRFAAEDLCQGQLGDCWLLSALSLLALHADAGTCMTVDVCVAWYCSSTTESLVCASRVNFSMIT